MSTAPITTSNYRRRLHDSCHDRRSWSSTNTAPNTRPIQSVRRRVDILLSEGDPRVLRCGTEWFCILDFSNFRADLLARAQEPTTAKSRAFGLKMSASSSSENIKSSPSASGMLNGQCNLRTAYCRFTLCQQNHHAIARYCHICIETICRI